MKFLNEIKEPKVSELGGKGYSLAILVNKKFNIPKGFIITSEEFFDFLRLNNLLKKIEKLNSEINEGNFQEKSKEIKKLILSGKIPEKIRIEVERALNKLSVQYVSIRSSGVSEDSLKASFAGMHDTFLNIRAISDLVLENVKKCWASLFNDRAVIYRIRKEIPHLEGIAVVVQEMIPAEISGIIFTSHPTNEKAILIEFAPGLGDAIVGGEIIPGSITLDRKTLSVIERKPWENKILISEKEIIKIAKISLKVEEVFSSPQDIEWCLSDSVIWILQSRAITTSSPRTEEKTKRKVILGGLGASPGIAEGTVKVVLSPKEVSKMNEGEILVTVMTNPLYVSAIQKAKAIVTNVGGMICHAAIIARELGIPCVVGTKKATEILKDNMKVVVNGTEGKIYASNQ